MVRPALGPDPALLDRIARTLQSGRVTNHGPAARELEVGVAGWLGVDADRVAAVATGSDALLLGVRALGLPPGKVAMPSWTYISTASAFAHAGIEPVFVDVDPRTYTLDPVDLHERLDPSVVAICAVTVYGVPPDLPALARIAADRGIVLVHDDAHGFGTEVGGARHTDHAVLRTFSTHATKVLAGIEGGLVVADPAVIARVRALRNHGFDPADRGRLEWGYNAKMDELRALVALQSLADIDGILDRRRAAAAALRPHLPSPQHVPDGVVSNWQNLALRVADREAFAARLAARGVEARRYFHPPLHHSLAPHTLLPATDALHDELLCLPLYSDMSESEVELLLEALR